MTTRTARPTAPAAKDATVQSVLNHLASMPGLGHASVTREQLREIMLTTGGEMILLASIYDITQKHLGAGIYRVSTVKRAEVTP